MFLKEDIDLCNFWVVQIIGGFPCSDGSVYFSFRSYWHICRYLQIIELADKYLCPLIIFKGILILLAKSTASSCARMDGVRDSDISLSHHMNLPVLHCKQRFSIRVSRDVYTQIPFKGTVAVESSPSTSQQFSFSRVQHQA